MAQTPSEYCYNKEQHLNAGCVFSPNSSNPPMVSYEGCLYTFAAFDLLFPVDAHEIKAPSLKGKNSDGTKEWMNY